MRYHTLALTFISFCCALPTIALEESDQPIITPIIAAFASNDVDAMAKHIQFPYHGKYPSPPIKEGDFIQRFDEIFDADLIHRIARSDVESDWSKVGWRGIMLNRGIVWVGFDGKIKSINHTTQTSKQVREKLIASDKTTLPRNLREFESPILKWKTAKHFIRIDALKDENYRYTQWTKQASKAAAAPDFIIESGEPHFEGSGGNHYYEFKHGETTIRCDVVIIGIDDTPGYITTYLSGVEVEQAIVLSSE